MRFPFSLSRGAPPITTKYFRRFVGLVRKYDCSCVHGRVSVVPVGKPDSDGWHQLHVRALLEAETATGQMFSYCVRCASSHESDFCSEYTDRLYHQLVARVTVRDRLERLSHCVSRSQCKLLNENGNPFDSAHDWREAVRFGVKPISTFPWPRLSPRSPILTEVDEDALFHLLTH